MLFHFGDWVDKSFSGAHIPYHKEMKVSPGFFSPAKKGKVQIVVTGHSTRWEEHRQSMKSYPQVLKRASSIHSRSNADLTTVHHVDLCFLFQCDLLPSQSRQVGFGF